MMSGNFQRFTGQPPARPGIYLWCIVPGFAYDLAFYDGEQILLNVPRHGVSDDEIWWAEFPFHPDDNEHNEKP